jgi:hypothetical protein
MANLKQAKDSKAHSMGLHKEVLKGRTQQFFLILKKLKISFTMVLTMLILIKELKSMRKT